MAVLYENLLIYGEYRGKPPIEELKKMKLPHIRVEKKDHDVWNVFFGNSYVGRQTLENREEADYDLSEDIIMSAEDIRQFANEIRIAIKDRTGVKNNLFLRFRENKPQFAASITFITPKKPETLEMAHTVSMKTRIETDPKFLIFSFSPSYNICFCAVRETREEYQYLYENGGKHVNFPHCYSLEDIEKFADDLESESGLG